MAPVMVTLFFLLLLPFVACSQSNGTRIATGSSLVAGNPSVQSWRSPSDDFAFGFQNVVGSDLFLLSIWFYKVPENNIVWFAKADDNPILAPRGSKIELTASKGLVLLNPQGGELWKSVPITPSVAFGTLSDTGNLVLGDTMNGSIWETFRYPTDTLLPTQKLEKNGVLSSLKSPGNFSLGRFQFRLLDDGNAVLNTMNLPSGFPYDAYYISGTYDPANSQNSGNQVILDEHGFLYVLKGNGAKVNITKPRVGKPDAYYFRATMNSDGVLTVSSYLKGSGTANERWKDWSILPENICSSSILQKEMFGSGTCGYNSLCAMKSSGRPSCNCPQGYSRIDPSDEYGDCKPDATQGCEEEGAHNHSLYHMVELPNTNWPMHDYERISGSNEQDCRSSCLEDCFCVLAHFGVDGTCWKKRPPLSNGRQDPSITATSFLKLRKDDVEVPRGRKKHATIVVVMAALLGGSVFLIFLLLGFKCLGLGFFALKKEMIQAETRRKSFTLECNLIQFSYQDLFKATVGFKEELGRGSCGIVYKGTTEAGPVAVKKLDRMFEAHREREFRTEVSVIGQTHHKNLVRLLGYCNEGNYRMLVYQFMSNGSLSSFLFNGDPKPSWKLRAQIAYEIARGLLYLHEECNTHIIHCDIKPQNILLDDDYTAKISDFGLAKMLKMDQSRTETGIRGTKGYVAPEWFRSSPVNAKVDVYSYGVLLLEIICCRRNVEMEAGDDGGGERGVLTDWAYDCYEQGRLDVLIEGDMEAMDDFLKVERFVKVAIWCLQEDTSRRPTMKDVMLMLEGNAHVSSPPCPSPFTSIV